MVCNTQLKFLATALLLLVVHPMYGQVGTVDPAPAKYIVGPRDVLNIVVFSEPEISRRYAVEADGTFEFPWVGRVMAAGLSLRAIEGELVSRLKRGYLLEPQVTIEVAEYQSQIVFVTGEVRTPGTYPVKGTLSVLRALALAGSTTAGASSELVVLRPRSPRDSAGPAVLGDETLAEIIRVSVKDLQNGAQDIQLRDRDTVFVPKAETFFVTGQVRNPGSYVLTRDMTVLQAISLAGGPSERGSDRGVKILRVVDGKQRELAVTLSDIVQPGDTIVVRQRIF